MHDLIVIGGGPAGLTAAVYARRAGKSVLVIEKNTFGGQITWSPRVENYPGFASVSGSELGDLMTNQAMEQGAEVELEEVTGIRVDGDVNVTGMEVYDVYGKVVRTVVGANNNTSIRINVSDLSAGMYLVRVTTEQGVVTKRFVKK